MRCSLLIRQRLLPPAFESTEEDRRSQEEKKGKKHVPSYYVLPRNPSWYDSACLDVLFPPRDHLRRMFSLSYEGFDNNLTTTSVDFKLCVVECWAIASYVESATIEIRKFGADWHSRTMTMRTTHNPVFTTVDNSSGCQVLMTDQRC